MLACADGAGSAAHSERGANLACKHFVHTARTALETGRPENLFREEIILGWYREVRSALAEEAIRLETTPRQLACTLLTAIIGENGSVFAQVGDGAIVVRDEAELVPVFWPQAGDYINTTNFVSDSNFETAFQFAQRGRINEISLLTDGLQMLALNFSTRMAHAPFFEPMLAALRASQNADDLFVPLRAFLDSPAVNGRTDDDKTLLLAMRTSFASP